MSASTATIGAARRRGHRLGAVYRVETTKIASQLLPRLTALGCLLGPFAFAVFINTQSQVPADWLFGRWVQASGFAIPFVMLGFAGLAGFPVVASIVGGDIFASEDRQSTWKTILTRSSTRGDIFWGKTLAACTFSVAMVVLIAASSLVAGIVVVGTQPLIGLSGAPIEAGRATVLVLESFAIALVPTIAFTCVAICFSVVSRNSVAGILAPPLIAAVMVGLSVLGGGVVVRSMLLTTPFDAWRGLQIPGAPSTPLLLGLVVSVAYGVLSLDVARRSFRGRNFAGEGQAPLTRSRVARGALVGVAVTAVLIVGTLLDRTWITSAHVEASVGPTFRNLLVEQRGLLGDRLNVSSVRVYPICKRESAISGPSTGAADDWTCSVYADGPEPLGRLAVGYTLTVRPDGCYTADAPPQVVGPLRINSTGGGTAINPLSTFDGCMIAP